MSLLLIILIYLILFFVIFLYGKTLFKIYSLISKKEQTYILGIKTHYFYPFVGIAFISNILLILNFFIPLKSSWIVFTTLAIPLIVNIEKKIKIKFNLNTLTPLLFFPFLFSFYNNNPSSDAFMYHFQNQRYIYEDKIVFGLSNLFPNLGLVSIIEYFSVLLWNGENYAFVGFINILFLAGFYYFIIGLWKSEDKKLKNISIFILLISLLDNVGYGGGRNGYLFVQEVGKFDASFGIIFFICFILIFKISQKSKIEDLEIYVTFLLVLFSGQVKSTGYILFLPLLVILFYKKHLSVFKLIFKNYLLIFGSIIWLTRSAINSACLIFPVELTCIQSFRWYFPGQAKLLSQGIISNNRNPESPYIAYGNYDWISSYWFPENKSYLINFVLTFLVIFLITYTQNRIKTNKEYFTLLVISILNIFGWFLLFPNYRFSVGFFLSLYIMLLYKNLESENFLLKTIQESKYIFLIILLTSAIFVVRLDSYKIAIENPNQDIIAKYETPIQEYEIKKDSFGVKPINGSCITNIDCSTSSYGVGISEFNGYKMFTPLNDDYNLNYLIKLLNSKED